MRPEGRNIPRCGVSGDKNMRQAIQTKYAGPTETRGSRVLVRTEAGRRIYPWDDAFDSAANHIAAAKAFAEEYGWNGSWFGGASPDGKGYVFVAASWTDEGSFTVSQREDKSTGPRVKR